MRILIVSYGFGQQQSAEAICTTRFTAALCEHAETTVLTSAPLASCDDTGFTVLGLDRRPLLPRAFVRLLTGAADRFVSPHVAWTTRCSRVEVSPRPNLVYGRSNPVSSNLAAASVAARLRVPFIAHFSDPLPSPWDVPNTREWHRKLKVAEFIIGRANAVSFTTQQAADFVRDLVGTPAGDTPFFVVPHVAPPLSLHGSARTNGPILYAGRFYGRRTPDALLGGFALMSRQLPHVRLRMVGDANPSRARALASRLGVESKVEFVPFCDDLRPEYERAAVLVTVDAQEDVPVFLASKSVEILCTRRPVLAITPARSPFRSLAAAAHPTVRCVAESHDEVAAALSSLVRADFGPRDYDSRLASMAEFSGPQVASVFLSSAKAIVDRGAG